MVSSYDGSASNSGAGGEREDVLRVERAWASEADQKSKYVSDIGLYQDEMLPLACSCAQPYSPLADYDKRWLVHCNTLIEALENSSDPLDFFG